MEISAVEGLPEFTPGDSIAEAVESEYHISNNDVVCISSTIVSKVEGRITNFDTYQPSNRAKSIANNLEADSRFVEAVLQESDELLLESPFLLTVTSFGHVGPNAGIDRSNVPNADLLLLPADPDNSAERIRDEFSTDPAVIITDTCGRPFRAGQRGVAIGYAGIPASRDWRGESDRDGRELSATVEAVVDELAAAANIVTGEGNGGTPVAVVSGFQFGDHDSSDQLYRDKDSDLIRQALQTWNYEE